MPQEKKAEGMKSRLNTLLSPPPMARPWCLRASDHLPERMGRQQTPRPRAFMGLTSARAQWGLRSFTASVGPLLVLPIEPGDLITGIDRTAGPCPSVGPCPPGSRSGLGTAGFCEDSTENPLMREASPLATAWFSSCCLAHPDNGSAVIVHVPTRSSTSAGWWCAQVEKSGYLKTECDGCWPDARRRPICPT